jgi:PAS domain S-box-containing protein
MARYDPRVPTPASRETLLLVDDDRIILDLLKRTFEAHYQVVCASSGEAALALLGTQAIDLVVTDQKMPGMTGLELLARARQERPDLQAILLTAYTDPEDMIAAINEAHVYRYVVKPWDAGELLQTVRNALEAVHLRRERDLLTERLRRRLDAMSVLIELSAQAAATSTYQQLIDVVSHALPRVVPFDVAATLVVPSGNAGTAAMHLHCQTPVDEATLLATRDRAVELYGSHAGAQLTEGELLVNVTGERLRSGGRTPMRGFPVGSGSGRSELSLPLTVDGRVVGVIVLLAHRAAAFAEDDARTLDVLANETAQAVRRLQTRLGDERRKMALMVESMADGLVMADAAGELFLINPAARRLLGLPSDEPITTRALQERLGFYPFDLMRGARGSDAVREEIKVGGHVLHSIISPVSDGAGLFVGVVVVLRDITADKQLESRKEEFVSVVSHELRTPLTSISGALDIVLKQYSVGLSDKQRRYVEMARESCGKLNHIVDDLLDVSKYERGKLSMRMGAIDIAALVRDVCERFRPPAEEKLIQIEARAEGDVRIVGDGDRLGQVLNNLLANSIKFCPSDGTGRIRVRVFGPGTASSHVGISVWNNGEAIPADSREKVFEKFQQLENSATRKVGGTGLGLAIARGIVSAHGGHIWVEPGTDGAEFVFTLPVMPPEEPAGDEAPSERMARRVLVIDDDPDATRILKGILGGRGYAVHSAHDGDEALAAARELRPDAVTLDLRMPGVDGLALVEILKHDPETRHLPVVVLSVSGERDRAIATGADAYLGKPVDAEVLITTLSKVFAERGRSRHRVLLVDDDARIRTICREVLEAEGYAVHEADGGTEAQAEARRFRPDLILLDVMMPDIDGYTLAARIRGEPSTALTPIIFLSARSQTADKVRAFKLGAEDYLVKPFDAAELIARVDKALARREAELGASPTTKLPGSMAIDSETDRRLTAAHGGGPRFAFCYLDLDNLKAFNDYYGYAKADGVIRQTGDIVREVIAREGASNDFIGHIAGDDFVFITAVEAVDRVCQMIAASFDRLIPLYYNKVDRERGYIETHDRYGVLRRFPIMTVSIAALSRTEAIRSHAELAATAAELKQVAKAIPGTSYVRDGEVLIPRAFVKSSTGG